MTKSGTRNEQAGGRKSWRARARFLERMFPHRWGNGQGELAALKRQLADLKRQLGIPRVDQRSNGHDNRGVSP
jgi:hypothetical protein